MAGPASHRAERPLPIAPLAERWPFVGREEELHQLEVCARPVAGTGQLVVVGGDTGVGKSRLVAELARRLGSSFAIGVGRAGNAGLFEEALAAVACPAVDPTRPEIPRLLEEAGARGPVALVLEDLHAADGAALDLLRRLARDGVPPGVYVIGTTRPSREIFAAAGPRLIGLKPMTPEENHQLLRALIPGAPDRLLAELEEEIPLLSAGNPLFATQVLRSLQAAGCLSSSAEGAAVLDRARFASFRAPDSVAEAVEQRLEAATPSCRDVLAQAALQGQVFSRARLVSPGESARVDAALAEAEALGLLERVGGRGVFVHETIRERLESALLARERRHLALPKLVAGRARIADGRFAAGAEELEAACASAERDGERRELAEGSALLGLALGYAGQHRRARAAIDRARSLARELGDAEAKLAARIALAALGDASFDAEPGLARGARALELAAARDIGGELRYLATLFTGRAHFRAGRLPRARELLKRAAALAADGGELSGALWCHAFLGDALLAEGDHPGAERAYRRALLGGARDQDHFGAPLAALGLAHLAALSGEGAGSAGKEAAEEALDRFREAGNLPALALGLQRYAECLELDGRASTAASVWQERDRVFDRLELPRVDWWPPGYRTSWPQVTPDAEPTDEVSDVFGDTLVQDEGRPRRSDFRREQTLPGY